MPLSDEQKANLIKIAEASVEAERATGCPAEVSAAQCILESAWLTVMPPDSNNCFGIKDTDRYPGASYVFTKEYLSGEWKTLKLAFEKYPTLVACFTDHAMLITGGFDPNKPNCYYKPFSDFCADGDLARYVRGIAADEKGKPRYATDPKYPELILSIMTMASVQEAVRAARIGA